MQMYWTLWESHQMMPSDFCAGLAADGEQGEEGDGHEGDSPSGASGPRIKAYSPTKTPTKTPGTAHSVVADSREVSCSLTPMGSHPVSLIIALP